MNEICLRTDLYELTMAEGYWSEGMSGRRAVFYLFFRRNPFDGGFAVAAGIEPALDFIENLRFDASSLEYLASLRGSDGRPLFRDGFLAHLAEFEPNVDVHAVPEGTVVFPQEPILRVEGPILACQILETLLLNAVNFATLIATKAARIVGAAGERPVIEFGLRRAQGPDGGLSASRAAYIGGAAATSNLEAGRRWGIPVRGTQAHSWIMAHGDERVAFQAWAHALPGAAVFLVDTYDSLTGVRHAIEAGRRLRKGGGDLAGIRLDSGDLAWLATQARKLLDESGFENTRIIASNDLDEETITSLVDQEAPIDAFGVGTRLVTGWGDPALTGVYKLSAIRSADGLSWEPRIKLSEQTAKVTIPGRLQVRRFENEGGTYVADMIFDEDSPPQDASADEIVHPADPLRRRRLDDAANFRDLLSLVIRRGRRVGAPEGVEDIRERCRSDLARLDPAIRRLRFPHEFPAGLEPSLHERRLALIARARERLEEGGV
ncbi:MAG TPA: nicotinate phosphoribosyltransferase [Planctomycetes bacterium]|nr:nicotinate phosphoribosyltransferase [Planctomycetota bacterium]